MMLRRWRSSQSKRANPSQSESVILKAFHRKVLITNLEVGNLHVIIIRPQKIWIRAMGNLILIWVYLHQNNSDTLKQ